ncbi:MAG TPA: hypothetical protein VLA66_03040, partial [Thermoanaerobaculia bacterium]|nr:hypothetical protein [Thermoanaerobaculia bacterium]
LARARQRFAARGRELAAAADALLEAARTRRAGAGASREQVGRMGALGARFVDAEKLAGIVSHRRSGEPLAEERRSGLERARRQLGEDPSAPGEPQWLLARGLEPRELGSSVRFVDDPCAAAARAFDRAAAEVALRVRAARLVSLEAANALDPDRHLPWLDRLDWRGFDAEELALVPPVFAVVRRSELATGGLAGLSRLLLSGRPVEVLVIGDETGLAGSAAFEPALIGMAHREVFVLQASVAAPLELARGLERAARGRRGALVVLDAPPDGPESLDPWLVASARVAGRAVPLLAFDPDAGESWSRRLELDGNPDAVADWPGGPLVGAEAPGNGSEAASFTYADAALLDPAWRTELTAAGAAQGDLVPLADWLALAPEEALRRLPIVRAVDPEGNEMNLVVTRALASAARERLSFWRHLEELAGVRAEAVEEAAGRARAEAEERAARERAELEQAQAAELERVRTEADSTAAARIVQALIALGGGAPVAIGAFEAPAAPAAAVPPPVAAPTGTAAEPAAAEVSEEVWIDTALCTSCDECIRKFPSLFVYNADKQAVVKNPRGGSFRDIVAAAAACTARVIHPGKPWNPAEPDLAKWVEKAKAYQ